MARFLSTAGKCQTHYKAQMLKYFDLELWHSFDICLPVGRGFDISILVSAKGPFPSKLLSEPLALRRQFDQEFYHP